MELIKWFVDGRQAEGKMTIHVVTVEGWTHLIDCMLNMLLDTDIHPKDPSMDESEMTQSVSRARY